MNSTNNAQKPRFTRLIWQQWKKISIKLAYFTACSVPDRSCISDIHSR
jgi:hypothetical protein